MMPPRALPRAAAFAALTLLVTPAPPLRAQTQEPVDREAVTRIREEAFERSRVMHIASMLTDRYGPRLTNAPLAREGGEWVIRHLREWGIPTGRFETWGPFGRGWTNERTSVHVVAPVTFPVIATPSAWTPGTNGPVTAEVVMIQADSAADLARYRGQLAGKVVMYTPMREVNPVWEPLARRLTDAELLRMADAPLPQPPGGGPGGGGPGGNPAFAAMQALNAARAALLRDEGVAAVLLPNRGDGGTVFVSGSGGSRNPDSPAAYPTLVLGIEHYGRIARLLEMGEAVRMELDIRNIFHDETQDAWNLIAEIPGTDKADELVMLGAHFDTWHGATGATDNSSGSAVMIEAMRILKALDLPLRRTVRLALWMGEEQGLIGSRMHVERHFGNAQSGFTPAHARVSAYFNMDNGTGAFRGVYLQGNEAVAPIFRAWLAPFTDRGVTTLTRANTGGTDHLSFDRVGIPGFQFIQDPMEYSTRTHHSTMDSFERLQAEDLKLNAAVVAAFVYLAANREALLPRKP